MMSLVEANSKAVEFTDEEAFVARIWENKVVWCVELRVNYMKGRSVVPGSCLPFLCLNDT